MSVAVSDTGPINYLVLCGVVDLLPRLFERVIVPAAVLEELAHPHAPAEVRAWTRALPSWSVVQRANVIHQATPLGLAEREAIGLARETNADQVLLDDGVARRTAKREGLAVTGTVGIIEAMATRGLLNLTETLRKLTATNFRISPDVVRGALQRELERKRLT